MKFFTTCVLSAALCVGVNSLAGIQEDQIDAAKLLEGTTKSGLFDQKKIDEVTRELGAVRLAFPTLKDTHIYGSRSSSITLILKGANVERLLSHLSTEARKDFVSHRGYVELDAKSTGISKFDSLNKKYGAVKIKSTYFRPPSEVTAENPLEINLQITFNQTVDGKILAPLYGKKIDNSENYSSGELIPGDGDRIYRIEKPNEPLHYIFSQGRGDCPAGCTERTNFYFNLYKNGSDIKIEKLAEPELYTSLWGHPGRFALRIFANFDDLMAKTQSADWSLRLHAVAALGRVYSRDGFKPYRPDSRETKKCWSGLGEDDDKASYKRDEASMKAQEEVATRVHQMCQDITSHTDAVKKYLEHVSRTDKDSQIRQAALQALSKRVELDAQKVKDFQRDNPSPRKPVDYSAKDWWKNQSIRWSRY